MDDVIKIDVDKYNELFGLETQHPLVSVVDWHEATRSPGKFTFNYGVYALFLKQTKCGDLRYGRQFYDYEAGTVTSFAPGQVVAGTIEPGVRPEVYGLLFHPDLIKGTPLGREIRQYSFFSYSSNEALHLSQEERALFIDSLMKIKTELSRPIDKFSKKLISKSIELLLDYCMRFYARQFVTRSVVNRDVLTKFETLLDDYFDKGMPRESGLPSVKYFADKICLSPNYFGDLIKKETGKTAQEYIQGKLIDVSKEMLMGTRMTISQISYELGFQYSQHFNRVFKKKVGYTPSEYRTLQNS